jgi:hypothetical protein
MNAKELRIGNLIYVDGNLRHVCGTSYKNIQHNYHPQNSVYSENYENECNPIPITEEWLSKFEIYNLNTLNFKMGDLFYDLENKELGICGIESCTSEMIFYAKCEYVHQLQNLYFALTEQELTIKDL